MKARITIIAFFSTFFAINSFANDNCRHLIPKTSDWYFANVILDLEESQQKKMELLRAACRNYDTSDDFSTWLNNLQNFFRADVFYAIYGEIPDAFRNLGNSLEEKIYLGHLLKIKKFPAAIERIKATYELVIQFQKPYDNSRLVKSDQEIVYTPENALKYGGVCRDFARMLKWSLQQVARSSSLDRDAEVFTPEIHFKGDGKDKGHAWVSVNVPVRNSNGHPKTFARIDLDSTNYTSAFVPLMPLAKNLSNSQMQQNFKNCEEIIACLK